MGLGGEVVDLVRVDSLDQCDQARTIGQIAVVQEQPGRLVVWILVEVVDPGGVEGRSSPDEPVNLIALLQQQLGEIGAVLAGNAGDECSLLQPLPPLQILDPKWWRID
jgi:hypothetical protein